MAHWITGWGPPVPGSSTEPGSGRDHGLWVEPPMPQSGPATSREPLTFSGSHNPLGWGAWSWRPQVHGMWCLQKLQELV